ncbi:hypothetical protein [Qipengyuania spongiae]|uniref:Uncharacterized protein n=1 Tax=Qipengyuania spongiae TaxID=2909673 RepID=A0ABY5T098_9SPHN|nr:hypothetical protein [Qipengyuania spongiae]UVI38919.1 hypothetical protein L1F33_11820 [Qipengyuania spongiae]
MKMPALFAAVAVLVAAPSAARDHSAPFQVFDPVSDEELANIAGGRSWILTEANTEEIVDAVRVADEVSTGRVLRLEMDVWWGFQGAELIAAAVRDAGLQA